MALYWLADANYNECLNAIIAMGLKPIAMIKAFGFSLLAFRFKTPRYDKGFSL